ncbi:MAG: cupin domain-containing protein [Candidatus Bathyarchaeia archaeon]
MIVFDTKGLELGRREGGLFLGPVGWRSLVDESIGSERLRIAIVKFPPGVRTKLHSHEYDQCVLVIDGRGILATEGEEHRVGPGALIFIPKGERHWHGSDGDNEFLQLAVYYSP